MEPTIERSIAERAANQLGHITRQQLLGLEVDYRSIRRWVDRGRIHPVGRNTFRLAGVAPSWRADVMAACLDVGAVASHRTAARLHGFVGFERYSPIDILQLDGNRNCGSGLARIHRTTSLPSDDVLTVQGIPTTGVARTVLGISALNPQVSDDRVRDAVDAAVRDGLATDSWLCWHLAHRRCRGRNGVCRMEAILAARMGLGPTESWLEREFLTLLQDHDFPLPIVQSMVRPSGILVARVDCCYEPEKIAIELKGYRHHSTQKQLEADAARENALQLAGYRVLLFTYDHVVRQPEYILNTIASALGIVVARCA